MTLGPVPPVRSQDRMDQPSASVQGISRATPVRATSEAIQGTEDRNLGVACPALNPRVLRITEDLKGKGGEHEVRHDVQRRCRQGYT